MGQFWLKKFRKGLMGTVFAATMMFAGAGHSMATTVDEAIRLAVQNNPVIGAATNNRLAVDEELRQARGLYLPRVDLDAAIGPERTSNINTRAAGDDNDTFTRTNAGLTITQRLFDGFDASSQVERQKARIESSANRVYERSEFIALDVIGAYLEVIRQRELLALARDNVAFHVTTLDALVNRLRGGVGNRADVTQTQARLARSRATFVQTNNDLADAEALYTRLVGQHPGDLVLPTAPYTTLPRSIEDAVRIAAENNPSVRIAVADVDVAKREVDIAGAPFYPQVTLEGNATYDDHANGVRSYGHQQSLLVRMRWNVFNGGQDYATRQERLAREAQSRSERYNSIIQAQEEARRSWFAYVASQQRVQELSSAVVFNEQTRDAYQQQFQVGQRTLLDVLDAENELFTSRGQLITSDVNQMVASYRLLATMGRLLNTMGIEAPEQSRADVESFSKSLF